MAVYTMHVPTAVTDFNVQKVEDSNGINFMQ